MLGLPQSTELSKQIPKKAIYTRFSLDGKIREQLDADIAKITIVNELSPSRTTLAEGKDVKAIYVMLIAVKHKDVVAKSLQTMAKLIPQNLVMLLQFEAEGRLVIYHNKLLSTLWQPLDRLALDLNGLNLDQVWEAFIAQIGDIHVEDGKSLDEQIANDERKAKIQREINRLGKKLKNERQPNKKLEILRIIKSLNGRG